MRKEHWLVLSLWVGIVFTLWPEWDGKTVMTPDPFPLYDFKEGIGICVQTYVFMIGEKLTYLIPVALIAFSSKKPILLTFFGLQVLDFIDFMMCYNSIWRFAGIPVSFNVINITVMTGYLILNDLYRWIQKQ